MKATAVYLGAYIALVVLSALILQPDAPGLFFIWLAVCGAGLLALVRWHQRAFAYRCAQCGSEFQIGFLTDLTSLQGFSMSRGWKYLRCPWCHTRTRATVVKAAEPLP